MAKILVLHGPNLNLLGEREPELYGRATLASVNQQLQQAAKNYSSEVEILQSNAEHELIDRIQAARSNQTDFIVFNPAGFTHTSIALRDALLAVNIPFIEVHVSNIYAREAFRQKSYFSDIAVGVISGLGTYGYLCALSAAIANLNQSTNRKG